MSFSQNALGDMCFRQDGGRYVEFACISRFSKYVVFCSIWIDRRTFYDFLSLSLVLLLCFEQSFFASGASMFFRRDYWRTAKPCFDVFCLQENTWKTEASLSPNYIIDFDLLDVYAFLRQMYSQKKRKKKIRARLSKVKRNPIVQATCAVTLSVSVTWKNWKDLTFVTSIS